MIEINKFAELVEPNLKLSDKSLKIASYSTKNLVPVGENYGSVILAVEVVLTNGEKKQLVAKLNPPSEIFKRIFNISIAFKKEAEFYSVIVPIMHNFQKESNVAILDSFPKSYGYRYSLSNDKNAFDEDACLLMENLKFQGYVTSNRQQLFDLSTSEYIIRMLAQFHALPVAIKMKKPEVFDKIKSHLPLNLTDPDITAMHSSRVIAMVEKLLLQDPEMAPHAEKVIKLLHHGVNEFVQMKVLGKEPFNTISHNDVWITNIMLKFDETGKPIGNRLVDYQMAAYGNPANDILFFLHSSTKPEIITEHFDQLIDIYFEEFIENLKKYQVDTKQFTKEAFMEEIDFAAKNMKLYHILFMIVNVFLEVKKEATNENILKDDLASSVNSGYNKHLKAIINNWIKHKWL